MTGQLEHSRANPNPATLPYAESGVLSGAEALLRFQEVQDFLGHPVRLTIETLFDGLVLYRLEEKD